MYNEDLSGNSWKPVSLKTSTKPSNCIKFQFEVSTDKTSERTLIAYCPTFRSISEAFSNTQGFAFQRNENLFPKQQVDLHSYPKIKKVTTFSENRCWSLPVRALVGWSFLPTRSYQQRSQAKILGGAKYYWL